MPVEYAVFFGLIGAVGTLVVVNIGLRNQRRVQRYDDQDESARFVRLEEQLKHISFGVDRIVHDMTSVKGDIRELYDRLVCAEQEIKSAHRRVNELNHKS